MENVKNYRVRTKPVTAMHTYEGQPLYEIRDFLLGCKNIGLSLSNIHGGFVEAIGGTGEARDLVPGDYIVMDENRYAAFMSPTEFESRYEEQVSPSELHYVIRTYGFSVQDAEHMLRDEGVRAILLAPIHEASKCSQTTNNFSINARSEADAEKMAERIHRSLGTPKYSY